jgi:DNA-binding transcriptional MerR regulator
MFSAREVARLAGFTKPWMLNHLEREDIFIPETPRSKHHGKHRNYTLRDLVVLRSINRLLELGARPKRIKQAITTFASVCPDTLGEIGMDALQLKFATSSGHFVVTKDSVLYCRNTDELIDLVRGGQLAFSFMVDNEQSTLPSLRAACEVVTLSPQQRRTPGAIEKIAKRYAV